MNVEYLKELDGEIPLLTKDQLEYLKDAIDVMEEKILSGVDLQQEEEKNLQVIEELTAITEKLTVIIKRLKDGPNAKMKFLENYPKWIKIRKDGIDQIRTLAKSMQNDRFYCNMAKLVGYKASAAGSALCLAGISTGGLVNVAGGATVLGASLTEFIRLKTQINKVQKIIDEDEKYFQEMRNWIKHSCDLEKALAEILQNNTVQDVYTSAKDLVTRGMEIKKHSDRLIFLEENLTSIIKCRPKSLEVFQYATVVLALVVLFQLLSETKNRLIFDFAILTLQAFIVIIHRADDIDVNKLLRLFNIKIVTNKAVLDGAFSMLGIALNVASAVLTSIDIFKGSRSEAGEKLLNVTEMLEKEACKLEKVYENIT